MSFVSSTLAVGDILWYVNDDISTPTQYPHPHVIVAIDGEWVYTVCGTSQQATIERKIIHLGHQDNSLFPAIAPNHINNTFTDYTFFDCCDYYEITKSTLQKKHTNNEIVKCKGKTTYGEYDQIRRALKSNSTIDIIDLLVHEED